MKRYGKAGIALLLALALMLSLAACGKQEEAAKPEDTQQPEMVYTAAFQKLSDSSNYMNPQLFTEDGFYAVTHEKVGTEVPEGATIEYEGQYDVYETRLQFVGKDGKSQSLTEYEPLPKAENTENYPEFYSGSGITGMCMLPDGNLAVVENSYVSYFNGPADRVEADDAWQNWEYRDEYFIRVLDSKGKELSQAKVEYDSQNDYLGFYRLALDEQGNLLCSGENQLVAIKQDGSVAYTIDTEDYFDGLAQLKDGRLGLVVYGEKGQELRMLDMDSRKISSESYALPNDAYGLLRGGGDYDAYYVSGQTLYGYRLETQEAEKILNWMDVDVNANNLGGFNIFEDGSILGVISEFEVATVDNQLVTLTQVPYDSVPHKQELTLASMDSGYNYQLSNRVVQFNRKSETTRIRLIDYAQYNTEDDYSAGLTKLTTELLSGNLPDLLCLSGLPYKQLAGKGFLEDLYPYVDADKELNREDFFPTVLQAMEVDGKLYELCSSFAINSLIGASSVVGDTPGWTYADFDRALASMPAGCDPLDAYTTRDDILRTLVFLEMDDLVDWNSGKVSFDNQNFVDILNFSARFPAKFDWDNYEWSDADQAENRIREGRQMLLNAGIYDVGNILYNDMYFGGETTYIGYPTNNGVGNMLQLGADGSGLFAMSSQCVDKEAAWQFLRGFLLEKNQMNSWGLPSNVKAFDAKLKTAMTPEYRRDAEGNIMLDENGEKIQISRGSYGMADGSVKNIYAMTQEQADKLMEVINSTTKVFNDGDDSIFSIVNEQAQAFFAGQKSAEEVARLIQSKANIYVNEQR